MRFSIAQKIFGIAAVVLVIMVAVAAYSIHLTGRIADELDAVANRNLPVSEGIARVNVGILEKGILLQEIFQIANDPANEDEMSNGRKAYEGLARNVVEEFERIKRLVAEGRRHGVQNIADLSELSPIIDALELEDKELDALAGDLILARVVDDMSTFQDLLPILDEHQTAIDDSVRSLLDKVEALTDDAVRRADRDEKTLLYSNLILTILATILGLAFAAVVTRVIVRAVKNLVTGTEAVETGNLDVEVQVTSGDEIGKLTASFNGMVSELRLKERIKDTFGKYMDPRIVSNLLENPEFAQPGGEQREMTVMFIDLKGFTSISEALDPDELVQMINSFFGHMTEAISRNKGVVDKFMGDAVMAYWGPPFTEPDAHAALACRAATEALEQLEDFRSEIRKAIGAHADGIEIDLRIGISTGEMVVGTIGSTASRSFTVMGDPVNLGSRLEGANKAYGTRIMISEGTRMMAGDGIAARELDLIRVKGKEKPTRVYELTGMADGTKLLLPPAQQSFHEGLSAYRRMDWDVAEKAFQQCLDSTPDDAPSNVYMDRVRQLRSSPPPDNWDGVWVFETK